jgi:hypothetical protein
LGLGARDANLYRYTANGPTDATDPTGLIDDGEGGHLTGSSRPGWFWRPWRPTHPAPRPTSPKGNWTPGQFFGPGSPLIEQTRWGCGGLAAWRAGTAINPAFGLYNPLDIPKMPGAQQFGTFPEAEAGLAALGGNGVIIAIQNPFPDWTQAPGSGNFATWFGDYWEYANHGGPGRKIFHAPMLPDIPIRVYIVVPR